MKLVRESLNPLPEWDDIISSAPDFIQDRVEKMKSVEQSLDWHPEGSVYNHVRIVFDRARETGDPNLLFSALFHDLGKVETTKLNKRGGWSAHGHEDVSVELVERAQDWIREWGADPAKVHHIVKNHMRVKFLDDMRRKKRSETLARPYFRETLKFSTLDSMKNLSDEEMKRYK